MKLLIDLKANIHARNDEAFIKSCMNGRIEVIKLLIENGANIHAQDDEAFIYSCMYEYIIEVFKLLIEHLNKINNINEVCLICKENKNKMIKLNCNHVLCIKCFIQWIKERKILICPYCLQQIKLKECYINE